MTTAAGHPLGTVCVLDHEPRRLDDDQLAGLEDLAAQASALIRDRYGAASLERERAFLASVLDALDEHVAILDEKGRIVATNEAWDRFARENEGEPGPGGDYLQAARVAAMEGDREAQEAAGSLEALLEGEGGPFGLEYGCRGPDVEQWFRMEATAFEERGRRWVIVVHRDIQPERAARRVLEQSEEMFQEMAAHLDVVSWLISPDLDEVHYVSPAFEALFHRSRDAFYQDPGLLFEWVHPEDREQVLDALARVDEGIQEVRFRLIRPDGSIRRVEARGFPVRDGHGKLDRIAGITRDITAEEGVREQERQRARAETRAVELEQVIFATSHTLRTEVRRIRSFGQLLQQRAGTDLEERIREPLDEILEGSAHLDQLHQALREYAETTRGEGTHGPVDLEAIVREVTAARSHDIEGPGGGSIVGEIPLVHGDAEQLYKLVSELVDNAVKFRGELPVELSIEAEDRGETVEVHVRDNGRGFDPAYAERVFGLFQQLEPETTEGVGVGLTICRRIVENHGGTIRAEAEPGKGATFTFTLPVVDEG